MNPAYFTFLLAEGVDGRRFLGGTFINVSFFQFSHVSPSPFGQRMAGVQNEQDSTL
jgi:hypothetical protein